jgi:hypothetical protein
MQGISPLTRVGLFILGWLACLPAFSTTNLAAANPGATNCVARPSPPTLRVSLEGKWHSLRIEPPPDSPKIHWYNKLNPVWWFKNADEPVPPSWYKPHDKCRVLKYHLRNSFHNFNWYVIGIADKRFVRYGRYPDLISNPHGGWNFAVSRYRFVCLPFVSYRRGWFEFYFGWRDRGNFGIKLNIKRPPPQPTPAASPGSRAPKRPSAKA